MAQLDVGGEHRSPHTDQAGLACGVCDRLGRDPLGFVVSDRRPLRNLALDDDLTVADRGDASGQRGVNPPLEPGGFGRPSHQLPGPNLLSLGYHRLQFIDRQADTRGRLDRGDRHLASRLETRNATAVERLSRGGQESAERAQRFGSNARP